MILVIQLLICWSPPFFSKLHLQSKLYCISIHIIRNFYNCINKTHYYDLALPEFESE